jgi:hypothetical protein
MENERFDELLSAMSVCFCTLCSHHPNYGYCYLCPCHNHASEPVVILGLVAAEELRRAKEAIANLYEITRETFKKSKHLDNIQDEVRSWVERCFGASQAHDARVRGLRLLEESIEFAQASGVELEKAQELARFIYSRPAGNVKQELGGVAITALAAASAHGLSFTDTLHCEHQRIMAKSPDHFTARNQAKCDAGFK